MNVFTFSNYKEYIQLRFESRKGERNSQKSLCEAIRLHPSFLSKVLHGDLHLTPEHVVGMTRFWKMPTLEADYLYELVNLARAGTPLLRNIIENKLAELSKRNNELSEKLTLPTISNELIKEFYYSSWAISAIHVLLSIDGYQTLERLATRLRIPELQVQEILTQLFNFGLVSRQGERWLVGHTNLHLSRKSPFHRLNNLNWKIQALSNLEGNPDAMHYCNVHSISASDFTVIRENLSQIISQSIRRIHDSPPEKLACLNIDYFEP